MDFGQQLEMGNRREGRLVFKKGLCWLFHALYWWENGVMWHLRFN
ncbi:hypothetical protein COLO4_13242 [Corchorus olitorius]|uniref:Uncharacterized protein n=1 Tax=Corchorus olitorius TaxID=93759 RepID=A0A1R3JXU7_9ROSI|nr:hypothetical protein COLO4_13242 [Corchorus olitorius]